MGAVTGSEKDNNVSYLAQNLASDKHLINTKHFIVI